ncbi:MAG: PqqD family protein [Clostridiales bacterium]|nr:PqqD family protein [Clostridiales bacterium]
MKTKNGFVLRELAGNHVVVAVGEAAKEFNGVIRLNKTGAFLWSKLQSGSDEESLVAALLEEYDIDPDTAKKDVSAFVQKIQEAGLVE